MRISEEVIQDILKSANIVDVIGHYIPLIKKGRGYTALCPFHDDHDPSLSISEEKQIYKCFVCGNGGNVFTFVQNYKKCSFVEAVAEVAKIVGKPLNIDLSQKPKAVSKYQKYYDLMNDTVVFANSLLSTYAGEDALAYLNNRGLTKEVIDFFEIGYNPKGEVLYKYLKSKKYPDEDLTTVNVCRMTDYGMKDVFANRVIFPIHDINGNAIAFSGRIIDDSDAAKYVNTNTNIIYEKGNVIYNYHRAKDDIKRSKRVLVCEGVMDVIAFKRAGIGNVVATLGTACTTDQIRLLNNLTPHIVFCYDGDKAGQNAIMKAIELCFSMGIEASAIRNDTNLDPDEIINQGEAKDLRDFADQEITGIEFAFNYYQKVYPLNNYSNRKKYYLTLSKLIDKIADQFDRDNYHIELQRLTGYTKKAVKETEVCYNNSYPNFQQHEIILDGLVKAEYIVLSQMILSKKAVELYRSDLGYLIDETNDELALKILEEYRNYDECSFASLVNHVDDEHMKQVLLDISTIDTLPMVYDEEVLKGAFAKIKSQLDFERLKEVELKIAEYEHVNNEKYERYLREYADIVRKLNRRQLWQDQSLVQPKKVKLKQKLR